MPTDSVGYRGQVPTWVIALLPDKTIGRFEYPKARLDVAEADMLVSLRASVARDKERWVAKTKIEDTACPVCDRKKKVKKGDAEIECPNCKGVGAFPYKWHKAKVTFGPETVERTMTPEGHVELVVSVGMEVK